MIADALDLATSAREEGLDHDERSLLGRLEELAQDVGEQLAQVAVRRRLGQRLLVVENLPEEVEGRGLRCQ